jgi:hypothetical protein
MHCSCRVYLQVSCDSDNKWPPFLCTKLWLTGLCSGDGACSVWDTNWIFMWLSDSHHCLQTAKLQAERRAPALHLVAVSFISRHRNFPDCPHFRRTNARTVAQSRRWLLPSNVPSSPFFLIFLYSLKMNYKWVIYAKLIIFYKFICKIIIQISTFIILFNYLRRALFRRTKSLVRYVDSVS